MKQNYNVIYNILHSLNFWLINVTKQDFEYKEKFQYGGLQ